MLVERGLGFVDTPCRYILLFQLLHCCLGTRVTCHVICEADHWKVRSVCTYLYHQHRLTSVTIPMTTTFAEHKPSTIPITTTFGPPPPFSSQAKPLCPKARFPKRPRTPPAFFRIQRIEFDFHYYSYSPWIIILLRVFLAGHIITLLHWTSKNSVKNNESRNTYSSEDHHRHPEKAVLFACCIIR
jgi:hypothetical protein